MFFPRKRDKFDDLPVVAEVAKDNLRILIRSAERDDCGHIEHWMDLQVSAPPKWLSAWVSVARIHETDADGFVDLLREAMRNKPYYCGSCEKQTSFDQVTRCADCDMQICRNCCHGCEATGKAKGQ